MDGNCKKTFQNLSKVEGSTERYPFVGTHHLGQRSQWFSHQTQGVTAKSSKTQSCLNIGEHEAMGCMTFRNPSPVAK